MIAIEFSEPVCLPLVPPFCGDCPGGNRPIESPRWRRPLSGPTLRGPVQRQFNGVLSPIATRRAIEAFTLPAGNNMETRAWT